MNQNLKHILESLKGSDLTEKIINGEWKYNGTDILQDIKDAKRMIKSKSKSQLIPGRCKL